MDYGSNKPTLLTIDEAARALRLSRSKTYAMAQAGELPTVKLGRSVRIHAARLQAFLDELASEADQ